MLKDKKRAICMLAVLSLVLSLLAGCGVIKPKPTPESLIGFATEVLRNAESEEVQLVIDLNVDVEDGEHPSVDTIVNVDAQLHHKSETSHLYITGDVSIDNKTDDYELESYVVEDGNDWHTYFKETKNGETAGWDVEDGKSNLYVEIPTSLLLELIEDENPICSMDEQLMMYNDRMCYIVFCQLENIADVLDLYDIDSLFEIDYEEVQANVRMYFDFETKYIQGVEIDFKNGFEQILEDEDVDATVEQMLVAVTYISFDELRTIKVPKSVKKEIEEANTEPPTETMPVEPDNTNPIEPTVSDVPTSPELPDNEPPANGETFSQNWTDLDIKIDGTVYHFPYDYDSLKSTGWSFDLADYGHENGYVLNPNQYIYSTINLNNPKYETEFDSAEMTVGFKNYSETVQDILDCDIWALKISRVYGFELLDNYPEVELAGGISWGATKEDIIEAYGNWDEIYESEYGYIEVTYNKDYDKYMELVIYDDYGLAEVALRNYK